MIRQKFDRQKISIAGVLVARKNNRRHFKKLIAGTLTANKIWRALLRRKQIPKTLSPALKNFIIGLLIAAKLIAGPETLIVGALIAKAEN